MNTIQYGLILIPRFRKDSGFFIADQLLHANHEVCGIFNFLQRFNDFMSDPNFNDTERNKKFFIKHYENVIFRPGFPAVVFNFCKTDLELIIRELKEINPDVKTLIIFINPADVVEIEGVDVCFISESEPDTAGSEIMEKLGML